MLIQLAKLDRSFPIIESYFLEGVQATRKQLSVKVATNKKLKRISIE